MDPNPRSALSEPGKISAGDESGFDIALDDHLGDAVARVEDGGMLRVEIDQRHFDLATISGIDGAGRVEHGDALLGGKAGARMDQCHISCGQGYSHTGGEPVHAQTVSGSRQRW